MSVYHPEPSTSSMPSSSTQRPRNRPSPSAYATPQRPMASQHQRRASGSALTIQTQFTGQYYPTSSQGAPEYPSNPRFSYLLNSVLGSPFLTTTDILQAPSHFSLDNGEEGERDMNRPRPPSPSPTADYSIIDAEELESDNPPVFRIPGGYPYAHQRSMSSSFANFGLQSCATWSHPRRRTYDTGSGLPGTPFLSLNHPTESISMPNVPQPLNPFKTLLPRILDALASPSKAFSGSHNSNLSPSSSSTSMSSSPAGSPTIFPHSISLPTGLFGNQSHSGRQSPLLWNGPSRANNSKGKGRAHPSHFFPFTSEPVDGLDYSDLSPLDGEEGELIDEACFVDVRAVTGVDILALLPPELALYVLQLICPTPIFGSRSDHARAAGLDPLSNEAEELSKVALRAVLACVAVSRTWRRLANDNSVWRRLFLGRWSIDLRKADTSHMRKLGSSLVDSPTRQQKRHRWKLKHKSQAFKFGASSKSSTPLPCVDQQVASSAFSAPRGLCHPRQNFPLQFDWKKMYTERLQLEKRWRGVAFARVPVSSTEILSPTRETRRSMTSRGAPRSRSLSPTRFLGPGSNVLGPSGNGFSIDRSPGASTLGRTAGRAVTKAPDVRGMPASRTEPSDMSTLFKEQKWEPKTMELKGHSDSVYCVEFDSKRIITGSRDQTIMVWSLKTGKLLGTFVGAHTGSVLCLKFEKDWDLESSKASVNQRRARDDETSLSMDTDLGSDLGDTGLNYSGKKNGFMFTGSSDCTICVWSLETGDVLDDGPDHVGVGREDDGDRRVLAEPIAILRGHTGGVLDLRIDKDWIVSCSKDTVIRVWDRRTLTLHRMLRGHDGPVNAVGLQNGRVVSASGDGKMILWDIETGERLKTFDGHDRGLACIEFKNDLIVSGSNDCKIRVWNAWTGECLRTLAGHNALVRAISFDPKTGRLLSASYDKVVKVWDLYNGELIREFKYTHTSHIFDVKFDLGRIVSASHDRRICVLDFTAGLNASVFI